ncbi:hypothetical protein BDV59DRAFT_195441 [Aspergillus ambiguus]|uniref:putative LPS glycosyltransferase n=1 Tax=Aspergillus ambiguus TaxID=176160 RepID=UPI003CCD8454
MFVKGRRSLNLTRILGLALVLCIIVYLLAPKLDNLYWNKDWPASSSNAFSDDFLSRTQNETLGFEHIYAIGLKERTDKRDFLTLASYEAGFKVDWIDGVRPESLDPKSLPNGVNLTTMKPAAVACWRAHMNALKLVLENSYTTALILEDDADWDISIKVQLREFARGVRQLNGDQLAPMEFPYGLNWDILWIGGCASGPSVNETTFFAIPNDPTVPSGKNRDGWGGPLDEWKAKYPGLPDESTRYVYQAEMGCCTYGYAVSTKGAKKILAALSVDRIDCAVDNAMSDLCAGTNGYRQLKCFAPWPNLIGTYRHSGPASRDSDIDVGSEDTFHEAVAHNMVYSTRLNIHRLIWGESTVYSQHKNKETGNISELDLGGFVYPRGFLVG